MHEKTAAEVLAELEKDESYQRRIAAKKAEQAELAAILKADEKQLVADLKAAGIYVETVWDLVNSKASYEAAYPVLLKHLNMTHHRRTKEGIIRALTLPQMPRAVVAALIEEFVATDAIKDEDLKWVLGSALAEAASAEDIPVILSLMQEKKHGAGRQMLPLSLKRLPREQAEPLLDQLSTDPVLRPTILEVFQDGDTVPAIL